MADYSYKKCEDKYLVTNNEDVEITYEVKKLSACTDYLVINDGTILPGETEEFTFTDDGDYQIVLNDGENTLYIKHRLQLQLSIIEGVLNTICDCKCGCDCEDERDVMCELSMLLAKTNAYKRLMNPAGSYFYDVVYNHVKCLIEKPIYCAVDKEIILGEAECNQKLIKQMIALDYLAMYFYEIAQACISTDLTFIKDKFQISPIFCCIQSLGINIGDIEQMIEETLGTITIISSTITNLPPNQVGDYEITVANRAVTPITLDMFTTLTLPVYNDPEGDAVQDIRIDSLPADGILKLSGVPVIIGQIIPVADIVANLLVYESPDQNAFDTDSFNFSVRDVGSGLFSS